MFSVLRIWLRIWLVLFGITIALAGPAEAAAVAAKLSASDQADVARVERYINDIKTLQAKFIQIGNSGTPIGGTFSLSRPGRMRLVYNPPIKDFVVADGWFMFYWDGELEQQSSQPLGSSLADFFLRDNIRLSGDVTVTRVVRQPGALEVTIAETEDPTKGELTLVFEDKPLLLRSWRVLDAQNLTTTVVLSEIHTGVKLSDNLFVFREPKTNKPPNRR